MKEESKINKDPRYQEFSNFIKDNHPDPDDVLAHHLLDHGIVDAQNRRHVG